MKGIDEDRRGEVRVYIIMTQLAGRLTNIKKIDVLYLCIPTYIHI